MTVTAVTLPSADSVDGAIARVDGSPRPMDATTARLVVRRRIEHLMNEIDLRCDAIALSDSAVQIGELVREVSSRLVLIVEAASFFPQESET